MSKVSVIGAGFSGLSAASFLAQKGYDVHVFEKHHQAGGRARQWKTDGFTFDMGPSWYWMPDVFEKFFQNFGHSTSDFFELKRLDPSYRVFFSESEVIDLPSSLEGQEELFEAIEPDSGAKLRQFLAEAKIKYDVGMRDLVYKPSLSPFEFIDHRVIRNAPRLDLLQSFTNHASKFFKDERLLQLISFPVLFLGAKPEKTPALYSLMNYADLALGTWYPMGGMKKLVDGMHQVAANQGVEFHFGESVQSLNLNNKNIQSLSTEKATYDTDAVMAGADYHHVETKLLPSAMQSYSAEYWDRRTLAPSCLLFYVGVNKKVEGIKHHNLFFDTDFSTHAKSIYDDPEWPDNPLFYVCCPSKTDDSVAPEGQENLFFLIPIAPGINDDESLREKYFELLLDRLEKTAGVSIRENIVVKRSYCINNFIEDYNAFKGNAYGLANTLRQTAFMKPKIKSKKVKNLFYAGQLTAPGPGVPPSLISGEISANALAKSLPINQNTSYESTI